MFPPLKVELFDLNPNTSYILLMDMAPVDKYRYKYQNSAWVRCFEEECSPTRLYVHPDSPNSGSHWMNTVINFYKLKLTNNQLDKQGHVSYNIPPISRLLLQLGSDFDMVVWQFCFKPPELRTVKHMFKN